MIKVGVFWYVEWGVQVYEGASLKGFDFVAWDVTEGWANDDKAGGPRDDST